MTMLEAAAEIRSLRRRLDILEARLKLGPQEKPHTFADLYGILQNESHTTEEEIDAIMYRGKLEDLT